MQLRVADFCLQRHTFLPYGSRMVGTILSILLLCTAVSAPAQDVAGKWEGVYPHYPHLIHMQLDLARSTSAELDEEMTGTLRLEPLVEQRTIGRAPTGVVEVTARYDPVARRLTLTPGRNAYRELGVRVPSFQFVLDPQTMQFGGLVMGTRDDASYAMLGRSTSADAQILDHLRDVMNPGVTVRNPFGKLLKRGPKKKTILQWTAQLTDAYPDLRPMHTQLGRLFPMAKNLFRDAYFTPHFDKPFDELGRGKLEQIASTINDIPRPRGNFPEERPAGAAHAVSHSIHTRGGFKEANMHLVVRALRVIDAWRAQALKRLANVQDASDPLRMIQRLEAAETNLLATHWPHEREAFARAVEQARGAATGPALIARVDALLASTEGVSGALELHAAKRVSSGSATDLDGTRLADLMALVPSKTRQAQQARLDERIDALLRTAVATDREMLSRFGTDINTLEATSEFHADLRQKYGALATHGAVRPLFDALAQQRGPALIAAADDIQAQLETTQSSHAVDQLVAQYLNVPSDRSDPHGARLLQQAEVRKAALKQREAILAKERAEARRRAASACAQASTATGRYQGEPTERDMCTVIEAQLRAADENLEAARENGCTGSSNDPVSAVFCMMGTLGTIGGGPQLSVRSFRKVACAPALNRPGFLCDYVVALKSGNPTMQSILNMVPGGELITRRFVQSGDGWLAISLR